MLWGVNTSVLVVASTLVSLPYPTDIVDATRRLGPASSNGVIFRWVETSKNTAHLHPTILCRSGEAAL